MPTDLAQRHEVVTRTRSMHGRTQLQDQAARPLTAPECIAVAALIEAAAVSCMSFPIRTDWADCGRPFLADAMILSSTRCVSGDWLLAIQSV